MNTSKVTNELDIIEMLRKIFQEKKLLALYIGIFAVIGIIVALNKPKAVSYTHLTLPTN